MTKKTNNNGINDNTCNGQCSRCGDCCGLFIPITKEELSIVKSYVEKNNIKPENRIVGNAFKAHCCFYNEKEKKCNIYEVRPFVCQDFKCSRKDWKQKRNEYERRAYWNSTLSKTPYILATFDDLIYEDYSVIVRHLMQWSTKNGQIRTEDFISLTKKLHREDIFKFITIHNEDGEKYDTSNL